MLHRNFEHIPIAYFSLPSSVIYLFGCELSEAAPEALWNNDNRKKVEVHKSKKKHTLITAEFSLSLTQLAKVKIRTSNILKWLSPAWVNKPEGQILRTVFPYLLSVLFLKQRNCWEG